MRPHNFRHLADRLLTTEKNSEGFRSAVSRAYYAAFLTAEEFLTAMGVSLLARQGPHTELLTILANSGDAVLTSTRDVLAELRRERDIADYDMKDIRIEDETKAGQLVNDAFNVIAELNRCRLDAPRFAAVAAATRAWVNKLRGIA